jgi:hypothetical protein
MLVFYVLSCNLGTYSLHCRIYILKTCGFFWKKLAVAGGYARMFSHTEYLFNYSIWNTGMSRWLQFLCWTRVWPSEPRIGGNNIITLTHFSGLACLCMFTETNRGRVYTSVSPSSLLVVLVLSSKCTLKLKHYPVDTCRPDGGSFCIKIQIRFTQMLILVFQMTLFGPDDIYMY